jgi:hypothetical protein
MTMQLALRSHDAPVGPRAGILLGLAATAAAFGAAAVMSAIIAPTARADAYSDIVSAIDGDFTAGQASFATALTDFGSSDLSPGLAAFFSGVDDDILSPGINTYVGDGRSIDE